MFIESIELFAGIGVFIAGVLGILRTKIGLWKIPFALFILTGLFMTMGAGLSIVQAVGGTSGIDHFVSYVLSVGRILLILTIAHLMYMLTMLYDKSHLDVVMLSRKGFRDISKRLKKMYGNLGARQVLYSMGEEADYDQLRRTLENWNASEEKFLRWLPSLYTLLGWGTELKVEEHDSGRKIVLRTTDNFEVVPGGSGWRDNCDFTRGLLAGLGKTFNPKMQSESVENECQSHGDENCVFEIRFTPKDEK